MKRESVDEFAVGRHFVTGFDDNDIAYDYLLTAYDGDISITYHLHFFVIADFIKDFKFLVSAYFKGEADASSEHNCHEDSYWFE